MNTQFTLTIRVPKDFVWEITVRSFGFYLMAPNNYDSQTKIFSRPLSAFLKRVGGKDSVQLVFHVDVRHEITTESLVVAASLKHDLPTDLQGTSAAMHSHQAQAEEQLCSQIIRMFRLDVDLAPFHKSFPDAMHRGYGRTFRSPTLFEDVIKTMTGCNTSFANTRMMNSLLCEHIGTCGAFPTAEQVASSSEQHLRSLCRVGYRDNRIIRFARQVASGEFDAAWFDSSLTADKWGLDTRSVAAHRALLEDVRNRLGQIYGFGAFSVNNLLQLVGLFEHVPVDSESRKVVPKGKDVKSTKLLEELVRVRFAAFAPYQFLVYWFELYGFRTRFGLPGEENSTVLLTPNEAQVAESAVVPAATSANRKRKQTAT